jgi:negative regulator of sigma E activity
MNDELYNLWIQRADAEAPADFADRVMDAVRREPLPSSKGVQVLLQSSPAVRVAACILASLACLYRMVAVVAVFFVQ